MADYEEAIECFTDLIDYCPHLFEGWNQRAPGDHLRHDDDASLDDIAKALEIEMRHFGN